MNFQHDFLIFLFFPPKVTDVKKTWVERDILLFRDNEGPSKRTIREMKLNKQISNNEDSWSSCKQEIMLFNGDLEMKIDSFCPHRIYIHRRNQIGLGHTIIM